MHRTQLHKTTKDRAIKERMQTLILNRNPKTSQYKPQLGNKEPQKKRKDEKQSDEALHIQAAKS
jgi:hypothetical protein